MGVRVGDVGGFLFCSIHWLMGAGFESFCSAAELDLGLL
jgi:hypothetical protein